MVPRTPAEPDRSVPRSAARPEAGWLTFGGLALATAAADLLTKRWLFARLGMPGERPPIIVVPGMLALETNLNEGALFGMGQGMGLAFAAVSVAAIVGILILVARPDTRRDRLLLGALALISGGIVGNLWDRLGLPGLRWHAPAERAGSAVMAVRDWIHFRLEGVIDWPIFNLADTWLVIGAGLLVLASFRPPVAPEAEPQAPETAT